VSAWTGIPVTQLEESEKEKLAKLEEILHRRVVGQDEAISAVAQAIRRARTGLRIQRDPLAVSYSWVRRALVRQNWPKL